jgi:hypothetical protein
VQESPIRIGRARKAIEESRRVAFLQQGHSAPHQYIGVVFRGKDLVDIHLLRGGAQTAQPAI